MDDAEDQLSPLEELAACRDDLANGLADEGQMSGPDGPSDQIATLTHWLDDATRAQ